MLYAIIAEDVADSLEKRLMHRPPHLERLQKLHAEGRLFLAGPFPAIDSIDPGPAGYSGSLIVADFASLADAQEWAANDPFMLNGVYANIKVKPFRKTLP